MAGHFTAEHHFRGSKAYPGNWHFVTWVWLLLFRARLLALTARK